MKRASLRSAALIKLGSLSLACVIFLPPSSPSLPLGPIFCPHNSHYPDPSHLSLPSPSLNPLYNLVPYFAWQNLPQEFPPYPLSPYCLPTS